MKKVLFVATVYKFFDFEKSDMQILANMGYEIHTASNMDEATWLRDDGSIDLVCHNKHQIDFPRRPFSLKSFIAYRQLKKLIDENNFEMIHFHTDVAAAIGRVASIKAKRKGTKIVYTDHGFYFHKSSEKKNWVFYPIERVLARITDMIITINCEDYEIIKKFHVPFKRFIPGVGIDFEDINNRDVDGKKMRSEIGIPEKAFVLMCIGELSARKNQIVVLEALAKLKNPNVFLILCGIGEKENEYRTFVRENGLENNVLFLGFREHDWVMNLCHCIDVGVIPSKMEGLGMAGLEMMAAGKPLIGSAVHGIADYLVDMETGIKASPNNSDEYVEAINRLKNDNKLYNSLALASVEKAKEFDISFTQKKMKKNYSDILEDINHEIYS